MQPSGKRILVTGASGGIGRWLTPELVAHGHEVRAERYFDLRTTHVIDDACKDVDAVVHCAARSYLPDIDRPFTLMSHDLALTMSVLEAARIAKVKHFVFLSSALVYERVPNDFSPFQESATDRYPPLTSPIAVSKFAAERAVIAWAKETDSTYTIWRLYNVVTPHERHDRPAHVHVDLYRKMFVERADVIELAGSGLQSRRFTWVEDVTGAISSYLWHPNTRNQVLNLGGAESITISELAGMMLAIGKRLDLLPPTYEPVVKSQHSSDSPLSQMSSIALTPRVPAIAKVNNLVGWWPRIPVRQTIERFIVAKERERKASPHAG